MKKETWIVVANSTLARLFKLNNRELVEMTTMVHPESRLHDRDLVTDKPGVSYARVGPGRYGMEPQQTPKKTEALLFAKQVASHLDNARSTGQIDRLFLAATPSFLGVLRHALDPHTLSLIASEVDKDITSHKPGDIIGYFPIGL